MSRSAPAGQPLDPGQLVRLEIPGSRIEAGNLVTSVLGSDRFGNVQLAAGPDDLAGLEVALGQPLRLTLLSGHSHLATVARTFSDVGEGELLVFEDASRRLALGCHRGSAAARLGLRGGDELRISPASGS